MIEQTRVVENESGELEEQVISSSLTVYQDGRKPTLFESLIFIACFVAVIVVLAYICLTLLL